MFDLIILVKFYLLKFSPLVTGIQKTLIIQYIPRLHRNPTQMYVISYTYILISYIAVPLQMEALMPCQVSMHCIYRYKTILIQFI